MLPWQAADIPVIKRAWLVILERRHKKSLRPLVGHSAMQEEQWAANMQLERAAAPLSSGDPQYSAPSSIVADSHRSQPSPELPENLAAPTMSVGLSE